MILLRHILAGALFRRVGGLFGGVEVRASVMTDGGGCDMGAEI